LAGLFTGITKILELNLVPIRNVVLSVPGYFTESEK
jgi:hypothetical protein